MIWRVPLADVTIDEEEIAAVGEVLRSGWLSQGERVAALEAKFAKELDVPYAVAVTNGTAALHVAYQAVGLREGDEFIVPVLTFVATMNAGLYLGAKPVLADCVSRQDLTISVEDVARKISPRTKLIVTVPYGGFCPDMAAIRALARERGIALVEDACHAPLATLDDKGMGTWGAAGTFSFFSNKNMTTGEGGMVVTSDEAIAARVKRLRSHGMTTLTWDRHQGHAADYDVAEVGYNYRLDEMRAAIGIVQLGKLREATHKRIVAAQRMRKALEALGIEGLEIPFEKPLGNPVHHLFVILLPEESDRAAFRKKLAEEGIQTSMHYPLLHRFSGTRELLAGGVDVPVGESIEKRLVTLPMGPHMDEEKIGIVAAGVRKALV